MMIKYYVVSLPRSGTSSICKMAKICGLKPSHSPLTFLKSKSLSNDFDFFSDTPVYSPIEIENILKYENIEPKFIYIKRNFNEIFDSWVRVGLYKNYKNMLSSKNDELNFFQKFDLMSYRNAFSNKVLTKENCFEIFQKHKKNVFSIIEKNNNPLLEYSFSEGWKPFCDFLKVSVPNIDIPFLNKNKMFDEI